MTGSLANKVAIVTGGAQGLGRAISERLANEGCAVVVADVNEQGAKAAAAAIAEATAARVVGVKVDVTREAEVEKLFLDAERDFGRVDVVVSNAAILIAAPIADADAEKWRAVMKVNLFGYFLVTKHACRVMTKQRSGSIININSKSGKKGSAANSAYAATKFGCIGHTQSVALEMARAQCPLQRDLPRQSARLAAVDGPRQGAVRPVSARRQGSRRERRRGRAPGLRRPGADETRLQLRRRLQRGDVPRFRRVLVHHRRGAQRHRRPGDELRRGEGSRGRRSPTATNRGAH